MLVCSIQSLRRVVISYVISIGTMEQHGRDKGYQETVDQVKCDSHHQIQGMNLGHYTKKDEAKMTHPFLWFCFFILSEPKQ